jgi:hypothetical protein
MVQYNDGGIVWRDMRYASPTVGWLTTQSRLPAPDRF